MQSPRLWYLKSNIFLIIILLITSIILIKITNNNNSKVSVYHKNKLVGEFDLSKNREIKIENSIIEIKDGKFGMKQSDCKNRI